MSTLLSDLDSSGPAPGGDGDLVQKILMEMGGGGGGAPPPPMPANAPYQPPIQGPPPVGSFGGGGGGVINSPNSQYAPQHVMDSMPPTAHMIGGAHPTPADFAAAMGGSPSAPWVPESVATAAAAQRYTVSAGGGSGTKKSFLSRVSAEFRAPFLVLIIVFAFSLPVVNFLFAHYLPKMVKSTGELKTVGLLIKSAIAGGLFWVLNSLVIPLLKA